MTLEEAIHREEALAYSFGERYKRLGEPVGDLQELEVEHRQMAEWLKALKEIWNSGDCNDCRNGQCEWKPKLGQLVRFNCPHYVGVANEEVNAD
ncbi:MAG: hypothetical protein IIZ78_26700, partial [Clostridiales bacterium]|nr:hypothetical protein [Clostridiales bacterium]